MVGEGRLKRIMIEISVLNELKPLTAAWGRQGVMVSPANETGMCETLINVKNVKKSKMQKFRFSESKAKVMFFSATNSQLASGINVKNFEKSKIHVIMSCFSRPQKTNCQRLRQKGEERKRKEEKKCKLWSASFSWLNFSLSFSRKRKEGKLWLTFLSRLNLFFKWSTPVFVPTLSALTLYTHQMPTACINSDATNRTFLYFGQNIDSHTGMCHCRLTMKKHMK